MHIEYLPKTFEGKLVHLNEECAEVIEVAAKIQKAIAKIQRFGLESTNISLPKLEQKTNRQTLINELLLLNDEVNDLKHAVTRVTEVL